VETSTYHEQNYDDISLEIEQVFEDIKPEIKGKMLMVHEPVRDTTDKKPE
jgi:hypothetical protein